jgi:penicillin-binding protein 1C
MNRVRHVFDLRRFSRRATRRILIILALPAALVLYVFFAPFDSPESRMEIPGTVVLDAHGTVLQRDARAGLRIPVTLDQVAPIMVRATIAAEDQRFDEHPGVDPIAVGRAIVNMPSQRSGASTITQQLARRLYLRDESGPPLLRKAREAVIAFQLEAHRSKDEILTAYLNEIYYGRGAYGVEAAARVYFGVSAGNLNLSQAAYLAGLPQLPSVYDPEDNPGPALARRQYVLDRLVDDGDVTRDQANEAGADDIHLLPQLPPVVGPHFVQYAMEELRRVRPDLADRPGLVIETTLDAGLQQETERVVKLRLDDLRDRNVTDAAVVVLDPASGRIVTMVGSADFSDQAHGGQLNMAVEPRQPGSALKPFLYAAAFEHGFTPATPLLDVPTTFETPQGPYAPLDYDRQFHGIVSVREALASSFNVPAVRTLDQLGIDTFLEMAHRVGLRTLTDAETYGLSLVLGGGDVRLIDLTGAYGAIATEGQLVEPYAVARVRDTTGRVLYEHPAREPQRVLSDQDAYLLADILSDRDARIPGFGQVTPLDVPFRAGVKTGTTTGFKDNWTVGFTPGLAVGVWVGNADASPMEDVSGVAGAGPIWRDVMMAAVGNTDPGWLQRPAGIVDETVCAPTGLLPGPDCPSPVRELFVSGTQPGSVERYYSRDPSGQVRVNPPAEARAWAIDSGLALAGPEESSADAAVRVVQPGPGSVFFVSPELKSQELVLRASIPPGAGDVEFRVDGRVVGRSPGPDPWLTWRLDPGQHRLEVVARLRDGTEAIATSTYEVRNP